MFTLKDRNISKHTAKLSNGARIVLFEQANMPISIHVLILGGSRHDKPGKEGTAHFLEHMLLAGTGKFPTKDKLSVFIEDLGGVTRASTGSDVLKIDVLIAQPEDIYPAIHLLSEELTNSLFSDKTLETERGSIQRELAQKQANPMGTLYELSRQIVFQGTEVGRSTLGTKETISGISKDDLIGFKEEYLSANNLLFLVSGGIEISKLEDILEKGIKLHVGKNYIPKTDLSTSRDKHTLCQKFNGENLNFRLEFRTVNYMNKDSRVLSVLGSILGGARSSTLTKLLRYERGLVYSVSAGADNFKDGGVFGVDASISSKNIQEVLGIVAGELRRMKTEGPKEEELNLVKNRLIKSRIRFMQTADDWAGFHKTRELFNENNTWSVEDYFKEVEEVTREDIKRVATKYLNSNWYLSATGDIDEDSLNKVTIDL